MDGGCVHGAMTQVPRGTIGSGDGRRRALGVGHKARELRVVAAFGVGTKTVHQVRLHPAHAHEAHVVLSRCILVAILGFVVDDPVDGPIVIAVVPIDVISNIFLDGYESFPLLFVVIIVVIRVSS